MSLSIVTLSMFSGISSMLLCAALGSLRFSHRRKNFAKVMQIFDIPKFLRPFFCKTFLFLRFRHHSTLIVLHLSTLIDVTGNRYSRKASAKVDTFALFTKYFYWYFCENLWKICCATYFSLYHNRLHQINFSPSLLKLNIVSLFNTPTQQFCNGYYTYIIKISTLYIVFFKTE